jgi:O-antigen/teichoic acid export membrane protein
VTANDFKKEKKTHAAFSAARTAGNSFNIIGSRMTELLFSFFTVIVITRYLGPERFGIYAFIFTIAFTIKNILESGVTRIVIREVSINKARASDMIVAGLGLNLLMALVGLVLCAVVAIVFNLNTREEITALYIALTAQICLGMINTVVFSFIAFERTFYNLIVTVSNRVLVILLIISVIWFKKSFVYIFGAMLVGNLAGLFLALVIFNYKFQKIKITFRFEDIKYFFIESLPFTMSIILIQISLSLNVFLLKLLNQLQEISYYQVPNRLVNAVSTVPTSIFLVMLPFLTHQAEENSFKMLKLAYGRMIKYICVLMFPFCFIVTVFASDIVFLMMGKEFMGAVYPLQIIIWSSLPFPAAALSDVMLTSLKRQQVMTTSYGIFFGVNLIFGLLLIPRFQAIGASFTLVAALISQFVSIYCFVVREIGYVSLFRSGFRPFISICALAAFFFLFKGLVHAVPLIFFGLILYGILLFLLNTFDRNEKDEIAAAFKRMAFRRKHYRRAG